MPKIDIVLERARQGDPDALFKLFERKQKAAKRLKGDAAGDMLDEAHEQLLTAAMSGHAQAQFEMGEEVRAWERHSAWLERYGYRIGSRQALRERHQRRPDGSDPRSASDWYEMAAANGSLDASQRLAWVVYAEDPARLPDRLRHLSICAANGDDDAAFTVAEHVTASDPARAETLYRDLFQRGRIDAAVGLGYLLVRGQLGAGRFFEGLDWFDRAAEGHRQKPVDFGYHRRRAEPQDEYFISLDRWPVEPSSGRFRGGLIQEAIESLSPAERQQLDTRTGWSPLKEGYVILPCGARLYNERSFPAMVDIPAIASIDDDLIEQEIQQLTGKAVVVRIDLWQHGDDRLTAPLVLPDAFQTVDGEYLDWHWDGQDIHNLRAVLEEMNCLTLHRIRLPHQELVPKDLLPRRRYDPGVIACDAQGYCLMGSPWSRPIPLSKVRARLRERYQTEN